VTSDELKTYVAVKVREYTRWTKLWSFVHHTTLFGSAALSASAAIIIKIPPILAGSNIGAENMAAILAVIAALMGTIGGVGGFQRKWKTNRRTKSSFEQLELDFLSEKIDPESIIDKIQKIIKTHHDGIIGEI